MLRPRQAVQMHSPGRRRQQHVNRQASQVRILAFTVPRRLRHHGPEGVVGVVIYKTLVNRIGVIIQAGAENSADNVVRLNVPVAADSSHHRQMNLGRGGELAVITVQARHPSPAFPGIEKLLVKPDLFADYRSGGKIHLVNPHRDQVSPEFLTVELNVDEPVVVVPLERKRAVYQVV